MKLGCRRMLAFFPSWSVREPGKYRLEREDTIKSHTLLASNLYSFLSSLAYLCSWESSSFFKHTHTKSRGCQIPWK